jgi:hypothetical protein
MKFEGIKKTVTGIEVKDVVWNSAANLYLGAVKDPLWDRPGREWVRGAWRKNGECINNMRPELNLK